MKPIYQHNGPDDRASYFTSEERVGTPQLRSKGLAFYGFEPSDIEFMGTKITEYNSVSPNKQLTCSIASTDLVAIYSYGTDGNRRFYYDPATSVGERWTLLESPAFYVCKIEVPGLVPLYRYKTLDVDNILLTTIKNFGNGWTYVDILGYVVPSQDHSKCSGQITYSKVTDFPNVVHDVVFEDEIDASYASVSNTYSVDKTKTSTFSWTLTKTLTMGMKVSIEVGNPEFVSSSTEFSMELQTSSSESQEISVSCTYGHSSTITVEKGERATIGGYIDWVENGKTDFQLHGLFWTNQDGKSLPSDLCIALFSARNPNVDRNLFKIFDVNKISFVLDGVFTGSFGWKVRIETSPYVPAPNSTGHVA